MADPILRAAQREVAKLEQELNEIPAFRRWKLAKAIVEEYDHVTTPPVESPGSSSSGPQQRLPQAEPHVAPKQEAKAPTIIRAAVKYLRERNCRATSTEMADALVARGVEISGKSKAATLSAYLSAAKDEIDNVRGEGYGLKEWSKSVPPSGPDPDEETPDSGKLSGASWSNGHTLMAN